MVLTWYWASFDCLCGACLAPNTPSRCSLQILNILLLTVAGGAMPILPSSAVRMLGVHEILALFSLFSSTVALINVRIRTGGAGILHHRSCVSIIRCYAGARIINESREGWTKNPASCTSRDRTKGLRSCS